MYLVTLYVSRKIKMHLNFSMYIRIFDYMGHCSMSILLSNQSAAWVFFNLFSYSSWSTPSHSRVWISQSAKKTKDKTKVFYYQTDVAIVTFDILQNGDRNLHCTDVTSMVYFTQCLFHLYNEDSYNYNEDCFILYICILYVYIWTTSA